MDSRPQHYTEASGQHHAVRVGPQNSSDHILFNACQNNQWQISKITWCHGVVLVICLCRMVTLRRCTCAITAEAVLSVCPKVITECKSVQWILTKWKMKSVNCWIAPCKHECVMCRIATQAPQWTQTFSGLKACKLANPGVLLQLCSPLTAAMSPTSVWTTPVLQMQQVKSLSYIPRFNQGHSHFISTKGIHLWSPSWGCFSRGCPWLV